MRQGYGIQLGKEKEMIKRIAIIVTIVLTIAMGVLIWSANKQEQKEAAQHEEINEKRRPLVVKKQKIEQQIADLDKQYEANKLPKGTTQVIFTGLEADVFNICYPIMKEFEYTGVLALSLNQLPGMEGLMTVEQFRQLVNEGWDICVKWDASTPVKNWWPELQKQINALGLETGTVVYFTTGTYTKSLDSQIQSMGFSIVVHHGEEHDSLIQLNDEEGLWHLGSVGLMGEKPKLRLTEAIAQKGNITYLVGFELEDERYDERSFRSMLSYFETYETNLELLVSDMDTARQHYRDRAAVYEQAKESEYKQARAALEEELAALEEELNKLKVQ